MNYFCQKTPLHAACDKNAYNAVKLLISRGADINAQDNALIVSINGLWEYRSILFQDVI